MAVFVLTVYDFVLEHLLIDFLSRLRLSIVRGIIYIWHILFRLEWDYETMEAIDFKILEAEAVDSNNLEAEVEAADF